MSLLDSIPGPNDAEFAGADYERGRDHARLSGQIRRVYDAMDDGRWRTVEQICSLTLDPPTSVSAQLRNLRKAEFGAYLVERRLVNESGHYEYRVGEKGANDSPARSTPSPVQRLALEAADELLAFVRHAATCAAGLDALDVCTCGMESARSTYRAARRETRAS